MKEHEMLKEICDNIGYGLDNIKQRCEMHDNLYIGNVIGIIFTQEFMEKLSEYLGANSIKEYKELGGNIINNLDNPAQYLYNLLGLGQKN